MKQKQLLLFVLCLLQGASMSALTSFTSTTVEGVEVTYTIIEGNANSWVEVRSLTSSSSPAISTSTEGVVTIPETVYYIDHSYTVTRIGNNAFRGCSKITSVDIPSHVTSIGSNAFSGCTGLESTGLHNGIESIESSAYNNCPKLTGELYIPNSVISIGNRAFRYCTGITSVRFPSSLSSLPANMFEQCTQLASVTLPTNITSIGSSAFSYCTALESVQINGSVTSIGSGAFEYCSSLTTINLPNTITSLSGSAFTYCTSLQSITLPSSITTLENSTFSYCSSLASIAIPYGVISIGSSAFVGCTSLSTVTIPASVISIGNNAFKNCSGLQKVIVPDRDAWCNITFGEENSSPLMYAHHMYDTNDEEITSISIPSGSTSVKYKVCWGWSALQSVTIPSSVTTIGSCAFSGCSGLTSVSIPHGVTTIENYAFDGCSGLTSLYIPNNVTDIGSYGFRNCSGLTSLHISTGLTQIKSHSFNGCSGLTRVDIPEGITYIGEYAFSGCSNMASVSIPSTLTRIGHSAFSSCSSLTTVKVADIAAWCGITFDMAGDYPSTNPVYLSQHIYDMAGKEFVDLVIPEGVTEIKGAAFYNCKGLKSVEIPSTVTGISSQAFYLCTNLTNVYSWMETPPTLNQSSFSRGSNPKYTNSRLVLLAGTIEGYAEQGWTSDYFKGGVVGMHDAVRITIGEAGVATFCCDRALDFSGRDDIKAFVATDYDLANQEMLFNRAYTVPSVYGMLLEGTPGVYYVATMEDFSSELTLLIGVLEDTQLDLEDGYTKYILGKDGDDVGFFPAAEGSVLSAGKAFLKLPTGGVSNAAIRCVFEDNLADGIKSLPTKVANATEARCYNLQGQLVANPQHGIYIVNGKKVFVK